MEISNQSTIEGCPVVQDGEEIYARLANGETVYHWEEGDSMTPILRDREYCRIVPIESQKVKAGDAVFCDFDGDCNFMVHMVTLVSESMYDGKTYYQIGTTDGRIFGWTSTIYGLAYGTNIFEKKSFGENIAEFLKHPLNFS